MPERPWYRSIVVACLALVSSATALADDAALDDARTVRSWQATAVRATRGWLDDTLPRVYLVHTLDSAADALDDLAGAAARRQAKHPDAGEDQAVRIRRSETSIRQLHRAVDAGDRPAVERLAATLEAEAASPR